MSNKTCTKCGRDLPLSSFYRRTASKDGHGHWCKECHAEYRAINRDKINAAQKKYYASHKEERAEYGARNYVDNRDAALAWQKQYNLDHREERIAYLKQYHLTHKEEAAQYRYDHKDEIATRMKQYQLDHKEEIAAWNSNWQRKNRDKSVAKDSKRRALKMGVGAENLPDNYERGLYEDQLGCCYYCGCSLAETGHHLEHMIPLSRGGPHRLSNLVLSCPACNLRKGTKTAEEFLRLNPSSD